MIYDNGQFRWAARVLWSWHVYGHERASLLVVDYPTWKNAGLPVSGVTEIPQPKTFFPRLQPQWITTKLRTLLAMDNDKVTLIDVRTAEEYRGEKSKSHYYGHIPTAINIDWKDMSEQQGISFRLKSIDGLQTILSAVEGSEASLAYVALRSLGHNVAVYDGSWFEWGNTSTLPINNPKNAPASPQGEQ